MKFLVTGLSALAVILLVSVAPAAAQESAFTPEQEKALGPIIHKYIVEHPNVLVEAMRNLEKRKNLAKEDATQKTLAENADDLFRNPADPIGGNPDGDVTIVEFFDYNCGYCKRVFPTLMDTVESDGNIRFVFKDWPILGDPSVFAARASLAALKQDKYMDFHMAMMGYKGRLDEKIVLNLAGKVGLVIAKLKADMASPDIDASLAKTDDLARVMGFSGTPGLVVGKQVFYGAIPKQALLDAIAKARKNKG